MARCFYIEKMSERKALQLPILTVEVLLIKACNIFAKNQRSQSKNKKAR